MADFDWIGGRPSADPLGLYASEPAPAAAQDAPTERKQVDLAAKLEEAIRRPLTVNTVAPLVLDTRQLYTSRVLRYESAADLIASEVCKEVNLEARTKIAVPSDRGGWQVEITPGATEGTIRDLVSRAINRIRFRKNLYLGSGRER